MLTILFFTTCKKEISPDIVSDEISSTAAKNKNGKIEVCHREGNGTSHTITINANALSAHLAHGDVLGSCVSSVTICDQVWMVRNLDVTTYRNGDPILQVTDPSEWLSITTGAWCYYQNNSANGPVYGKLYNWYAVNDPRGLAPAGWHVPSNTEWATLSTCLGGNAVAGGKMKSTGTIEAGTGLWVAPNAEATNSSGFSGLPGGTRWVQFEFIRGLGFWWSSNSGYCNYLSFSNGVFTTGGNPNEMGLSVRCVRD